jgi:malonyl-CoA decarboxylase
MQECVAGLGGEVTARQRAAILGEIYLTLDPEGRIRFLESLQDNFYADQTGIRSTARELVACTDEDGFLEAANRMIVALVSPTQRLLRQFNALPQGVKFLVDLRADLLSYLDRSPRLSTLDRQLKELLSTWFDIGFLSVEHITWKSPAALLEKLISYEAVHAIHSWEDLHNRLESDRQCYAFFHPGMPEEPLIFVEVALVEGLATSIQEVLNQDAPDMDPNKADTAIFYSISNTQKGLQGISFGPFLIKQVVKQLRSQLPNLKDFSTLSPIPGFRAWLDRYMQEAMERHDHPFLLIALQKAGSLLGKEATLDSIFRLEHRWKEQSDLSEILKEPMLALCAKYLHELRDHDQAPIDPVARFHLGNGARIERINWLGDISPKGFHESCGLMVNYQYHLNDIEQNIEAYTTNKTIPASNRVRSLIRKEKDLLGS